MALASIAGLLLYFQIIKPWFRIQATLRRLASGEIRLTSLPDTTGPFKEPARNVWKISELLQQLDRKIADEEFSLRAILSSMVEGVLIADRSQRIRLVNEALVTLFSIKESPINRTVLEVFRKHDLQQALDDALEHREPRKIELTIETLTSRGTYEPKYFEVHITGFNPGAAQHPAAALVVFHDVTTIRNLEATRKEFLANVSHEFRTPLTIISGYIETLLDGALEDPAMAERSLKAMYQNTERLSLLIDDLLTISRLEDRAKLLEFHHVSLRDLLTRVIEHLEPNIKQRGAQVQIDWAADACEAEVDGPRIEQVFSNLLGNALRYGDVEHLRIRVCARRHNHEIHMSFADNGPGIPLADQAHIFERFYRVHKDRARDAGGTGLGLSIVKNVVQAHGGRVSIESLPGAGATFHVFLPVRQNANS